MYKVIFATKGLIDLNAFTTFGCNAKPETTSPIGYFGTGLKYAMAVLARENIPVTIYRGKDIYRIEAHEMEFRDKKFASVHMRKASKGIFGRFHASNKLPFTTELGKNWELWQAFRELYSNTLDENGDTFADESNPEGDSKRTYIVVDGDEFHDVFQSRDEIFLPEALRSRDSHAEVQIIPTPSKYIYYRGMRVHELENEAINTYNILRTITLTEDRTAKNSAELMNMIRDYYVRHASGEELLRIVNAKSDTMESKLGWNWCYYTPSETFKATMRGRRTRLHGLRDYFKGMEPKKYRQIEMCDETELVAFLKDAAKTYATEPVRNAIIHCVIPAIDDGDIELRVPEAEEVEDDE